MGDLKAEYFTAICRGAKMAVSRPPEGLFGFCKGLNPSEIDAAIIGYKEKRCWTWFGPPIILWVTLRLNIPQLSALVLKWPFLGLLKDFLGSVKAKTHQNLMDQFMVSVLVCLGHDFGPLLALRCVLHSKTCLKSKNFTFSCFLGICNRFAALEPI